MNRRTLLGTAALVAIAGCTEDEDTRRTDRAGVDSNYDIEDDRVEISGKVGYDCHTGFVDTVVIDITIRLDGDVVHQHHKKVSVNACGQLHDWSYVYSPDTDDWNALNVTAKVYDSYEDD